MTTPVPPQRPSLANQLIIESIRIHSQKYSEFGIQFNSVLINTVFTILKAYFIDNKKHVLLQAPTGTGKSIIGLITASCCKDILYHLNKHHQDTPVTKSYYLTSSKVLQTQLQNDIDRFSFNNMVILKGVENYPCTYMVDYINKKKEKAYLKFTQQEYEQEMAEANYKNRPCIGISPKQKIVSQYAECYNTCPYEYARAVASEKDCCITNYHYFVNVMRLKYKKYFDTRFLTICDEAHKISSIVDDIFSYNINKGLLNDISKLVSTLVSNRWISEYSEHRESANLLKTLISEIDTYFFFNETNQRFKDVHQNMPVKSEFLTFINKYFKILAISGKIFQALTKDAGKDLKMLKTLSQAMEKITKLYAFYEDLSDLIANRPEDLYVEPQQLSHKSSSLIKYNIKDINETKSLQTNFIASTNKTLFMSATMGNLDEFIKIYGLDPEKCEKLTIPSNFDFSHSPIYLCKSGYLTYKHFDKNIDTCIHSVIEICRNLHPADKGVIHTHTNIIKRQFRDVLSLYDSDVQKRFLFYDTSKEKDENLKLISESPDPLILIGASLTEGIDLKDDIGRFNILIKVPYPALSDYVKRKMDRCSFWYNRMTLQDIVQSIGRTNRSVNDQSTTYLIDSKFADLIFMIDDTITKRVKKLNVAPNPPSYEQNTPDDFDEVFSDLLGGSDSSEGDLPF
jgi:Rad3-related DNA helicase